MYKNINDYELLYMINENNIQADFIYKKYEPIIRKIARDFVKTGSKCGLEYDDLIQEGYIGLLTAIEKYQDNCNTMFYTYATICIKSKILNIIRSSKGLKKTPLNNAISYDQDNDFIVGYEYDFYEENLFDKKINEDDLNEKIIKFKNDLSFTKSLVFELKINGFSSLEISNLLELEPKTINNYWYYIKHNLKKIF